MTCIIMRSLENLIEYTLKAGNAETSKVVLLVVKPDQSIPDVEK